MDPELALVLEVWVVGREQVVVAAAAPAVEREVVVPEAVVWELSARRLCSVLLPEWRFSTWLQL